MKAKPSDLHPLESHQRQIHLDFHTSPHIPDVGVDFDASEFAATMKRAHVNSVTVFAKCHHGQCYYPTQTGVSHPAIGKRDLLGEQIQALHRAGLRAPIYTTVVWEEDVAQKHPEWRQMTIDGRFAEDGVGPDGKPGHSGMWKFNNFMDPDYQDYFESHLREICQRYGREVDGFFIDIVFFHPKGGWSEASRAFRKKHGLMDDTVPNFARFQGLAQEAFGKKFTGIIHGMRPKATVFYNAQNDGNMHPEVGPRTRQQHMTHFEIESLPSGFWGYFHFPRMARMQSHWDKPWLGMTGRFQKMWGDFGGIKPLPALEFECFRAQAMGGASSVGDQLPPRGVLDPAAYELIASVYEQWEKAEPFYQGARRVQGQIGIFSANDAGVDGGLSEEGAVLLCEEAHYHCDVIDGQDSLDGYELLILPDSTAVSPALVKKLKEYHSGGGRLLISHRAGFDRDGCGALDFLPLAFEGEVEKYPTYWRARKGFAPEMASSDRVFYQPGLNIKLSKGLEVLIDRVLPYFKRSDLKYSSHFQTPPEAKADRHPAVLQGNGFVYFADPIFREYRTSGNQAVKDVWRKVVRNTLGAAPFGDGLPASVTVYPMRRGRDLLLTLLHYIPVRKALDIDVIDERGSFAGERLRLAGNPETIHDEETGQELSRNDANEFLLPVHKGRIRLRIPHYFQK